MRTCLRRSQAVAPHDREGHAERGNLGALGPCGSAGELVMTSNRRAAGGACTLPDRWLSSAGRMIAAAAGASACESHTTKIPYFTVAVVAEDGHASRSLAAI